MSKLNKSFLILPFIINVSNSYAVNCSDLPAGYVGECFGQANKYEMTMKGFRLREVDDEGNPISFVSLSASDVTYDFASANANSTIANYITGASLPTGTYDAVSPILESVITVEGSTSIGSISCNRGEFNFDMSTVTDENGDLEFSVGSDATTGLTNYSDDCGSGNSEDECGIDYINSDGDYVIIDASVGGFPVTISDGDSLSFTMEIDLAESMSYYFNGTDCQSNAGELMVDLYSNQN